MRGRAARLCALALALALAGILAPRASAVVLHGPNGQLLGVTPTASVAPTRIPGAAVPHVSSAQATDSMTWHNGPVLHSSAPYLVFWDPGSNQTLASWKPLVQRYLSDVVANDAYANSVYAVSRQYYDATGYADAGESFSGSQVISDSQPYPAPTSDCRVPTGDQCVTDTQVQQELTRLLATDPNLPDDGAANPTGLPQDAPVYFVVLPPNVNECFTGSGVECADSDFCSYHSAFVNGNDEVLYALIPSLVLETNPKACQDDGNTAVQKPNGSLADVMLKYLTHEYIETITDPLLNAWWSSSSGNEVADDCNIYGTQFNPSAGADPNAFAPVDGGNASAGTLYNQVLGGDDYYLQSVWSNGARDCSMDALNGTVTAAFDAPRGTPVAGSPLSFDPSASSSTLPYSSVTWDWGDGSAPTFSSGSAPPGTATHTYATAGTYTVTLTLVDDEGNRSSVSHTIVVHSPPVASFTFSPAAPYVGQGVSFDASSSSDPDPGGSITDYEWNYGDGNTDSGVTPAPHVYTVPGTYTVTLTVTDSAGFSSTAQQQVTVVPAPPQASFTIDPSAAAVNQTVTVSATASDAYANITSYSWDFGDGTPAVDQTAGSSDPGTDTTPHQYGASGTYTVTLVVTADNGATTTVTHQLTVGPVAAFTHLPSQPENGTQITFDGSSSSDPEPGQSISTYTWDFGDGTPGQPAGIATHAYARPGTYTVKLTVTNGEGETDVAQQTITVADAPPTAAFSVTTPVPRAGQAVQFDGTGSAPSDPSSETIASYAWSFGDGGTGSGAAPTHTYSAPGTYAVRLTVTDSHGASSSVTEQVVVHALPVAAFSATPAHPLEGTPVSFNAGASQDPEAGVGLASYAWSFGDGATGSGTTPTHTYAAPGNYTVTLTVTSTLGMTATARQVVSVVAPPVAALAVHTADPYTGEAVSFSSTSTDPATTIASYSWNFGDGSQAASGLSPTHAYRNPGSYPVTLTVTDGFGHTATVTHRIAVALAGKITKVTVARKGTTLLVTLNAPGVLSGEGRTVHVRKAGTVALPIRLTAAQRRRLTTTHALTVRVPVRFAPAAGPQQTHTVIIAFRKAHAAAARLAHP